MAQSNSLDLVDHIKLGETACLNESSDRSIQNALKKGYREDNGLYLESDADEQLLIHIPFRQLVKLTGIIIKGPKDDGTGPKNVKLFINKPTMDFSDAQESTPVQQITLNDNQLLGEVIALRFVKFQNVDSLQIFVENNMGGEETSKLQKIIIYGQTVDKLDIGNIHNQDKGPQQQQMEKRVQMS